ncbi:MAG: restriction endonuclease subunit S [Methylococcales bacterium]|nr:restriction endonuclease subunit S [Methylococcales bacterium]
MAIISEITLSMINGRFDSEYYQPKYLESAKKLSNFETKKLVSIANVNGGKRLPLGHSLTTDGIPYVRVVDINDGFIHRNQIAYIDETTWRYIKSYDIKEDDVLVTIVGNTVGLTGILKENLGTANFTENCARIRSCKLGANYILAYLLSKYGQDQVEREKVGTAQPKLSLDRLRRFVIPVFESKELDKINFYISSSSICHNDSNRLYKEAQQLLESGLGLDKLRFQKPVGYTARFSELELSRRADAEFFNPEYQAITSLIKTKSYISLGRLFSIKRGVGIDPKTYSDNCGLSYIRIKELSLTNPLLPENSVKIPPEKLPINYPKAMEGDYILAVIGATIGKINLIEKNMEGSLYSNNTACLSAKVYLPYPNAIELILRSKIVQIQIQQRMAKTAQEKISDPELKRILIPELDFGLLSEIEGLCCKSKESFFLSKQLLEQAKARVEQLIEEAVQS